MWQLGVAFFIVIKFFAATNIIRGEVDFQVFPYTLDNDLLNLAVTYPYPPTQALYGENRPGIGFDDYIPVDVGWKIWILVRKVCGDFGIQKWVNSLAHLIGPKFVHR